MRSFAIKFCKARKGTQCITPDYAIGVFILFFFLCVLCGFACTQRRKERKEIIKKKPKETSLLFLMLNLGLSSLPTHAVFCVFENNSLCGELVADFIRTCEVARLARFLTFVYERFDLGIE